MTTKQSATKATRHSKRHSIQAKSSPTSSMEDQSASIVKNPKVSETPATPAAKTIIPHSVQPMHDDTVTKDAPSVVATRNKGKQIVASFASTDTTGSDAKETRNSEDSASSKENKPTGPSTKASSTDWYTLSNAHSYYFFTTEQQEKVNIYENRSFIVERNFDLMSYKPTGAIRAVQEQKWKSTLSGFKGYVPRIVIEFYANLHADIGIPTSPVYHKVYVRGHVYDFSPQAISDYLRIPNHEFNEFEKEYAMDEVASELLGTFSTWPEKLGDQSKPPLKVSAMTFMYSALHKMAMTNWWPTTHYSTVSENLGCFLYDLGTYHPCNLGQIIFDSVTSMANGKNKGRKLCFPCLITGMLQEQHPLITANENYTGGQHIVVWRSPVPSDVPETEEGATPKTKTTKKRKVGETSSVDSLMLQQLKHTQDAQQQQLAAILAKIDSLSATPSQQHTVGDSKKKKKTVD